MTDELVVRSDLAQRVFDRTSGALLVEGNAVRVLLDAAENYPAWLDAIRSAERTIFFENYIIEQDEVGEAFARALAERARAGVKVRFIRDWLGSRSTASDEYWGALEEAGVELRVFNPPSLGSPLGWISRDHRKMVAVDGRVGFVSGLCISQRWTGDPERGIAPWRDTGIEIRGPAVADVERAFKQVWDVTGAALPANELADPGAIPRAGDVAVRVVAGEPTSTDLFRLDLMIAAAAQRTLWLTDAYFVGIAPYVQALRNAARDGVDVRLLVPSTTDLPVIGALSRSGYRPLLEAGVRIFEWNGPMIHAKSSIADGRWARVGSSNLNLASFIGNYELDVAIENEELARAFEEIYLRDLENSTEITLTGQRRVRPVVPRHPAPSGGSLRRPRVGAMRFASAVGVAAVSGTRALGAVESPIELALSLGLLALSVVGFLWPEFLAYPFALLALWLSIVLALRARRNAKQREVERKALPRGDSA